MRNLKITSCVVLPAQKLIAQAQCFCLDCDQGTVWVACGSELCCIADNKVCSVAVLSSHMTSGDDHVIGMEYLTDLESVCLALAGGNILLCNIATGELECVGEIEVGVVGMGWSPEQDLVVVVTGEDKLVLMTKDFDPLAEKSVHQKEFGEAQFIDVGWGKKATQFHGSEGKPKTEQLQEKTPAPAVAWDDRQIRISWRGDGDYFAVSAVDPESGSRVVRVWTRDCALHSTSETMVGLEQTLAWKPSGSIIASTQLKPHRSDVVFFERNGLQHGEFTFQVPPTDAYIKELLWSADSSVLCAWCRHRDGEEKEWLQLWTVGNYHWYLKQEIVPARSKDGIPTSFVSVLWDPVVPLKLHLLTTVGQYLSYTWHWTISESKCLSLLNCSGVAVIDGSKVLYTPFRYAVVPPPMSAVELQLPAQVSELAFSPLPNCNDFVALLTDFRIAVFSVTAHTAGAEGEESRGVVSLPVPELTGITSVVGESSSIGSFHALRQCVWWKEDRLLAVGVREEGEEEEEDGGAYREEVLLLSLTADRDKKTVTVARCSSAKAPGPVLCLHGNPSTGTAVIQLTTGEVLRVSGGDDPEGSILLSPWLLDSGASLKYEGMVHCEKMELAQFNGKERVIGLCESRCQLYVDDLKVISGCISFAVHDEFLLLTNNTHVCHFFPLNSDPKAIQPVDVESLQYKDKSVRRVERGSRIVTVVPMDTRVVLQMPRGNLETICPRALVLSEVRRNLDKLEFGAAFQCMREHRLNFNLIYDHNPKVFMANIPRFIDQLCSVDYINLFLTELSEEDVSVTMYPDISHFPASGHDEVPGRGNPTPKQAGKVDLVCTSVREVLAEKGENHYLLSIITSYIKMSRPDLESVLSMIQKLKETQEQAKMADGLVTAAKALKYTMYLVDVSKLYDIALGMYNLPLVVMVAEKSQKDPKEYLPFLNQLNRLPPDYRCFKIDCHLKRYKKALRHISVCGPDKFEECFSLIKGHSLYPDALSIYTDMASREYKAIAAAYGHHLTESGKYKESGTIFYQCGCYQEAFDAFEKASFWEMVFVCSAKLQHTSADRIEAARRVAESLKSVRRFAESGRVFLDYADDVEEAVVALLEGSLWAESLRVLHLHQRRDLVETHFLPALVEAHDSRLSLFQDLRSRFIQHSSRLVVVRENKKLKQTAILEGTYVADEKDADLFSDTSSITGQSVVSSTQSSQYSKSSGRTHKSRRKANRKKHSLREGSVNEEEALVEALADIVTTVDSLQDDVESLLSLLVQFGFTKEAAAVQGSFAELLTSLRAEMDTIWPSKENVGVGPADIQKSLGAGATVNSIIAAMMAARQSPITTTAAQGPAPKLRDSVQWKFDSLSL